MFPDPRISSQVLMLTNVPKSLTLWWSNFSKSEQENITGVLGRLPEFMNMVPRPDLIEALLTFWDRQLGVFRFGLCELTPTLEEVAGLVELPCHDREMVIPSVRGPNRFFRGLGLTRNDDLIADGFVPLDYLTSRFASDDSFEQMSNEFKTINKGGWRRYRIKAFCMSLLGVIVFPREGKKISTRILSVVETLFLPNKSHAFTIVPMILAELQRALNRVSLGDRFFEGSNLLLQLWAFEHLLSPEVVGADCLNAGSINRPQVIERWLSEESHRLPIGFQNWVAFLEARTSDNILWAWIWLDLEKVIIKSLHADYLVLVGLRCIIPYRTCRVLRQLQRKQNRPKFLKVFEQEVDMYRSDFDLGIPEKKKVETLWKNPVIEGAASMVDKLNPVCLPGYTEWRTGTQKFLSKLLPIHQKQLKKKATESRSEEVSEIELELSAKDREIQTQACRIRELEAELRLAKAKRGAPETHDTESSQALALTCASRQLHHTKARLHTKENRERELTSQLDTLRGRVAHLDVELAPRQQQHDALIGVEVVRDIALAQRDVDLTQSHTPMSQLQTDMQIKRLESEIATLAKSNKNLAIVESQLKAEVRRKDNLIDSLYDRFSVLRQHWEAVKEQLYYLRRKVGGGLVEADSQLLRSAFDQLYAVARSDPGTVLPGEEYIPPEDAPVEPVPCEEDPDEEEFEEDPEEEEPMEEELY